MRKFEMIEIEDLSKTGIYAIRCLTNSKIYIGSALSTKNKKHKNGFYGRWMKHLSDLKAGKHRNKYLQNSYNLYGESDFKFEIIEFCNPEEGLQREKYFIEKYNSSIDKNGFNIIKNPLSNFKSMSNENKLKLSLLYKGKKRPLEIIKKFSKKIMQIDKLTLEPIQEFYSISEASRKTGIQRQDIGQAIIGKKCKTAGGFIWKLVEDIV